MVDIRKIIFLIILSIVLVSNNLLAEELDNQKLLEELGIADIETEEDAVYSFPEIKPEAELSLGYRLSDVSGSGKAFEYEYLKDYPVFGGELRSFKYPHRLQLDLNINNSKDYFGDIHYAYKDIVLSRWINSTLFHNLDNIELIDLDPSSSAYKIDIRDRDDKYGIKTGINRFFLRLKTPDFPAHAFIKGLNVDRKGDYQQRSLLGSGWYTNIQRLSQNRDIDWNTITYETGVNSHLGLAEVEFSHNEKRFNVRSGEVLYDTYEASMFRPAGVFPHNQVSGLKGSGNKFKIHTLYTERLVASATFSVKKRENQASGATADLFRGAGSLQWTPLTRLSFFMRYSHTKLDVDNPETASITDFNGSVTTYSQAVKPSVSRTTDAISLIGRYRPKSGFTLKAKYLFKNISRDNADDWNLQDLTRKNTILLSANTRVLKGLNIKTEYTYKKIVNPSYNTEPDYSNKGLASISWVPSPGISLLANYSITEEERDALSFTETQDARDRNTRTDRFLGSGTFQLMRNLSFTASYAYMRYKIRQDIVYANLIGVPLVDYDVPMKDTAHVYSVSLNYVPIENLFLLANISHTQSTGEFSPNSQDLLAPVSIASFSQYKVRETVYHLSGDYKCFNGLSCGIDLKYSDFNDVLDNIHDDNQDGDAYIVMLRIKKRW